MLSDSNSVGLKNEKEFIGNNECMTKDNKLRTENIYVEPPISFSDTPLEFKVDDQK